MELLRLDGVSISYESRAAVRNISLSINEGDYFCIVGDNGSGKSTLLKGILGLTPLTSGSIEFGIPREQVAYLPQVSTITSDFPATVSEIVMTGTQKRKRGLPIYTKEDAKSARAAMMRLDIQHLAGKRIGELSGGQRQRVLLARALCRDPKLLVLDEPTCGLDENISECLYGLLADLNITHNLTILMVSHELDEVEYHATRIAEIDLELLYCGDVEDWKAYRAGRGCHEH